MLFKGLFNTLVAPETFASAQLTAADGSSYTNDIMRIAEVNLFSDIRFERQVQVYSSPGAKTDQRTVIEFRDSGDRVLDSCFVVVVEFDRSIHDAAKTSVGYCDFGGSSGVSTLKVGENRTSDLPENYLEGAVSPSRVLDHRPERGACQVTFTGKSAGFATFSWLAADAGKGKLRGLCPFIVPQ